MGKLSKSKKEIILNETIRDIHNIDIIGNLRKIKKEKGYIFNIDNKKYNIDLNWEKEDNLDMATKLTVYSLLFITTYMILFNKKYLLVSMLLSMSLTYTLYLDGSLEKFKNSFKPKLDREYKELLKKIVNKYLIIIDNHIKDNPDITKDKLLKLSLSDHIDIKYIIIGEDDILKRLVEKILETSPKLLNTLVTRNNADVIVRQIPNDIPELIIKRGDIVVEYTIDNGTFCVGEVGDKSKVVSIDVNDYTKPIILDDSGVNVFIE